MLGGLLLHSLLLRRNTVCDNCCVFVYLLHRGFSFEIIVKELLSSELPVSCRAVQLNHHNVEVFLKVGAMAPEVPGVPRNTYMDQSSV
jgi:hypothetical protein